VKTGYIALSGNYAYHSEKSVKHAISGLKRKAGKLLFSGKLKLTDTITRSLYAQITGACNPGIRDFLSRHGLENRKSITVAELLPLIKNEYGYDKFMKIVEILK
jgi:hypothetical protein